MADANENYIHKSVRGEVVSQIHRFRKDTENSIKVNKKTIEKLKGVETVHIYGLSFSPVDVPYMNEIASKVNTATTKWKVNFYSDEDKEKAVFIFIRRV